MSDVFVVEALRTPFGSFGGILSDVEAPQLAATVMKGLLGKAGLAPEAVDEVIFMAAGLPLTLKKAERKPPPGKAKKSSRSRKA